MLGGHTQQLEDDTKARSEQAFYEQQLKRQKESPRLGQLLLLYVDATVSDTTPFGNVRRVDRSKVVSNVRAKLSLCLWRGLSAAGNPATTRVSEVCEAKLSPVFGEVQWNRWRQFAQPLQRARVMARRSSGGAA